MFIDMERCNMNYSVTCENKVKVACAGNFPGGPGVKTLHFHCQGPRFGLFQVKELRSYVPKKEKEKLILDTILF